MISLLATGAAFIIVRLAHVVFLATPFFYLSQRTVNTYRPLVMEKDASDSG